MKTIGRVHSLSSEDLMSILLLQERLEQEVSTALSTMEKGIDEWNALVDPTSSGTPNPDSSSFQDLYAGDLRSAFRQVISLVERLRQVIQANKASLNVLRARAKVERLKPLITDPVAGEFVKYSGSELVTDTATQADPSIRGLSDVDFSDQSADEIMMVSDSKKLGPVNWADFGRTEIEGDVREQLRRISVDTYIESPVADDKYVYLEPTLGAEPEITYPSWLGGNQSFTLDAPATLYYHHELGGFARIR